MLILFPEDPAERGHIDSSFAAEAAACDSAGLPRALVNLELLLAGDADRAVRLVPEGVGAAIYRGWMVPSPFYATIHVALAARGVTLRTSPSQFALTHELPGWYPTLAGETPRSVWLSAPVALQHVHDSLAPFGSCPLVVKDYVKSRKHEWRDACFIRAADDRAEVERVVGNFIQRQGADLQGGVVFREFVELESVGTHPKSGMPLSNEFRLFVLHGLCMAPLRYWEEGRYGAASPPMDHFAELAKRIDSPFFSMDVARLRDGSWTVMELGDGQVSGLPSESDAGPLFVLAVIQIRRNLDR